jgi:hypothetical protein
VFFVVLVEKPDRGDYNFVFSSCDEVKDIQWLRPSAGRVASASVSFSLIFLVVKSGLF